MSTIFQLPAPFTLLTLFVLSLMIAPAHAEDRIRVDLEFLECGEESDEAGSDDPYAVMVGVNLRTGRARTATRCFRNVTTGSGRKVAPGKGLAFDDWVDDPADGVVLVALLEFDGAFNTGYVIVDDQFYVAATARVRDALTQTAAKYSAAYQQGVFSRQVVVQELFEALQSAVQAAQGGHELLGLGQFGLTGSETPTLRMTGDGSNYTTHFRRRVVERRQKNTITGVAVAVLPPVTLLPVTRRTVRIRLRDAATQAALPIEARLFQGQQVIHQSGAKETAWIETTLPNGTYRAQVRTTRPGYEILNHAFTVADQDVNLTLQLKPDSPPASGQRWVYDAFPSIEYREVKNSNGRWQELENGAVKQSFRQLSASNGFVELRDEVRQIWLRLYAGRCEISEDGVNFKPWFPGNWK